MVRVPTVILAASFAGMPVWSPSVSRRAIYERDGGVCQYTGRKVGYREGNLDHVLPRSRGGADSFENLVWSDRQVNARKADRLPGEAGLRLVREPRAPRSMPFAQRISVEVHRDWRWFLKR
jgi:5-methylcytosine-specific restriction endonuclease McrA